MSFGIMDWGMKLHSRGDGQAYYELSDYTDTGEPKYYGYLHSDGRYIIKEITDTGDVRTVRFMKGNPNNGEDAYATAWAGRAGLSYDYYTSLFE